VRRRGARLDPAISAGNSREKFATGKAWRYGGDFADNLCDAAWLMDKILRDAEPDNSPLEQPTKFDPVFNKKTAKALGLTASRSLLARAD